MIPLTYTPVEDVIKPQNKVLARQGQERGPVSSHLSRPAQPDEKEHKVSDRYVVEKADWPSGAYVVRDRTTGNLARGADGYIINDGEWHAWCRANELNQRNQTNDQ